MNQPRAKPTNAALADVTRQLAELNSMPMPQLRERWLELYGTPCNSRNVWYLRKRLAWRIQELAEGGLSERALKRIEELAPDVRVDRYSFPGRGDGAVNGDHRRAAGRDPRLPAPGTILHREFQGERREVEVLADGFRYRGETFGSLSAVARAITGTSWNGYIFFFGRGKRAGGSKSRVMP